MTKSALSRKQAPTAKPIPAVPNAFALFGHACMLMLAGAGIYVLGSDPLPAPGACGDGALATAVIWTSSALGLLTLALLFATRMRALGNIMHECAHEIFLDGKRANHLLGEVIGVVLLQPFGRYVQDHASHHSYLGDPLRDKDLLRYDGSLTGIGTPNALWPQVRLAASPHCFFAGLQPRIWCTHDRLGTNLSRAAFVIISATILIFQTPLLATLTLGLASLVLYPLLCVWSDVADHALASVDFEDGEFKKMPRARNHVFASRVLNLLLLPRFDGYHLVHHLFPRMPVTTYPTQHQKLLKDWPAYGELNHKLQVWAKGP
jgi:fatty acid desaturase